MSKPWLLLSLLCILLSSPAAASEYFLTIYKGRYTDDDLLNDILILKDIKFENSYLWSVALAKTVHRPADDRSWEMEGQIVKHFRAQDHWEFNALLTHRWHDFPWDHYLRTTFAFGNGFSQATETPPLEKASHSSSGAAAFLYYLLLETTYQPPQVDSWHLVVRIHHRSGIKGLINNVNGGANHISVGLKWRF